MQKTYLSNQDYKQLNTHIDDGKALYDKRDYENGAVCFKLAYQLAPDHTYVQQCLSQHYLMEKNYLDAKPICMQLIDKGLLSPMSLRKLKKLAILHEEPYLGFTLKQLMLVENYALIQRECLKDKILEKDTYLKMLEMYESQHNDVPLEWYSFMIRNRIQVDDYTDAKFYLGQAKKAVKTYTSCRKYATLLNLYSNGIVDQSEHRVLIADAAELLQKDPYNCALLSVLEKSYHALDMFEEEKMTMHQLKKIHLNNLKKSFNNKNKNAVRKRMSEIRRYNAICDYLNEPREYEDVLENLRIQKEHVAAEIAERLSQPICV